MTVASSYFVELNYTQPNVLLLSRERRPAFLSNQPAASAPLVGCRGMFAPHFIVARAA